jgi:hypothetical protein
MVKKSRTLRFISTLAALLVLAQDSASVLATRPGEATLPRCHGSSPTGVP